MVHAFFNRIGQPALRAHRRRNETDLRKALIAKTVPLRACPADGAFRRKQQVGQAAQKLLQN